MVHYYWIPRYFFLFSQINNSINSEINLYWNIRNTHWKCASSKLHIIQWLRGLRYIEACVSKIIKTITNGMRLSAQKNFKCGFILNIYQCSCGSSSSIVRIFQNQAKQKAKDEYMRITPVQENFAQFPLVRLNNCSKHLCHCHCLPLPSGCQHFPPPPSERWCKPETGKLGLWASKLYKEWMGKNHIFIKRLNSSLLRTPLLSHIVCKSMWFESACNVLNWFRSNTGFWLQ